MNIKKEKQLEKLQLKVIKAAKKIHNFHKDYYVIAGAKLGKYTSIKTNKSHLTTEQLHKMFHPLLKHALLPLGELGTKPANCPNYIGNCAEQHACNDVLQKNRKVHVQNVACVSFTLAYRPRTCQIVRYCSNCTNTFNIKN